MTLGAQVAVVNRINIVMAVVVSHVQIIRLIAAILDAEISIPPRIAVAPVVSDVPKGFSFMSCVRTEYYHSK